MKKIIIQLLLIFFVAFQGNAQNKDSVKVNHWYPGATAGINISQLALSNWTKGGDNQLTWTLTGNFSLKYLFTEWTNRSQLKFAFGRMKLGGNEFRTNDNELYLETVLSKNVGWAVDPFFSSSVRSGIAVGYNYKKTPPDDIADFFDPGYITQSLGFTYDKYEGIKTRLGFAVQEIFTNKYRQYSDNPQTSEKEAFKLETGLESVTNAGFTIMENVVLKSILRLFSRYEHLDVWDIRWDNNLIAKINGYLNVNLVYILVYEKNQSPTAQMKESLQLGFVYTII
ncbi:MAG: DUF3078 domain-containing protein [Ignavibacteriaceae bacterium]|nr:DUF3078 domain-containing protein [Ignavibacteriaceae bacterium]